MKDLVHVIGSMFVIPFKHLYLAGKELIDVGRWFYDVTECKLFHRDEDFDWVDTIHGDEIIYSGWKRTILKCKKCGTYIYIKDYVPKERFEEWRKKNGKNKVKHARQIN